MTNLKTAFCMVLAVCGTPLLALDSFAQTAQGCANAPSAAPSITGTYIDNFGSVQIISKEFWIEGGLVRDICQVDAAKKQIVAFNHPRDKFNPSKFSRFDWVMFNGRLWFCHSVFDASTEAGALKSPPPDPTDPRVGGCGDGGTFEWTSMTKLPQ